MRTLLRYLQRRLRIDHTDRFGPAWDNLAIVRSIAMLAANVSRGFWYRMFLGRSSGLTFVGKRVRIRNARYLSVGRNFVAEDECEINALSKRGIVFGDKVTVGSFALIRPTNYYGGEIGEGLRVGNNSNIGPYSYIGCSGYVEIGNNVLMSPRVSIYSENHNFQRIDVSMKEQGVTREFVRVEDDCWIASHSVILAGVTIGKGSIVAAGSVVTKDVPAYSIVAGVPAQVVRSRLEVRPSSGKKKKSS